MDRLDIIQTDFLFTFSVSDLDSLETNFGAALQVDDALDRTMLD